MIKGDYRELLTSIETTLLERQGLVQVLDNGRVLLTELGAEEAIQIWHNLSVRDRVLITLLFDILKVIEETEGEDGK